MDTPVETADIQPSSAGIVQIPLPAVAGPIGLGMIVHAAFTRTHFERIHRIIELDPFPTGAIVVLVEHQVGLLPLSPAIDQIPGVLMVGINQFGQLAETRVDEKAVGLGQPAHVPQRVHLIRIIEPAAHKAERTVEIEIVARRIVVVQIDGD